MNYLDYMANKKADKQKGMRYNKMRKTAQLESAEYEVAEVKKALAEAQENARKVRELEKLNLRKEQLQRVIGRRREEVRKLETEYELLCEYLNNQPTA